MEAPLRSRSRKFWSLHNINVLALRRPSRRRRTGRGLVISPSRRLSSKSQSHTFAKKKLTLLTVAPVLAPVGENNPVKTVKSHYRITVHQLTTSRWVEVVLKIVSSQTPATLTHSHPTAGTPERAQEELAP